METKYEIPEFFLVKKDESDNFQEFLKWMDDKYHNPNNKSYKDITKDDRKRWSNCYFGYAPYQNFKKADTVIVDAKNTFNYPQATIFESIYDLEKYQHKFTKEQMLSFGDRCLREQDTNDVNKVFNEWSGIF